VVRLAFHACVGGCSGCVNLNIPENNGLSDIVGLLEDLYLQGSYSEIMSRADFWSLAAYVALQFSTSYPLPLTFRWGRVDCPTAPTTTIHGDFPRAMGNLTEVERIFVNGEFNMTLRQTV
jgi:hypothetical protein